MYALNTLVFLLVAVVAFTNAMPLPHGHMRRSCLHKARATAVASASSSASATQAPKTLLSKPKASSSSSAPSPTSTDSSSSNKAPKSSSSAGGLIAQLFPVSQSEASWTTVSGASGALPLSDATLRPSRDMAQLPHPYVSAPDGTEAMQVHYAQGSYQLGHAPWGGVSFYAYGPDDVDLTTAKEATFGYSVMFEDGFDYNMGGKLPGLYGGNSDDEAISCSGGRRSDACFSARLMWRTDAKGELYTYLPSDPANQKQCNVAPESDCNPTYGASVGRGALSFAAGEWTNVSQRVRLNDVGQANGELEVFVGGQSVINVSGLVLRDSEAGRIRGIQMQSFFGGSTQEWASPKDQKAYFASFSTAVTEKL